MRKAQVVAIARSRQPDIEVAEELGAGGDVVRCCDARGRTAK
jgi:hypothetical protein